MAHNIVEGLDMVGSDKGAEWHGLARSIAEARAFLRSWDVEKIPAFTASGQQAPGIFMLRRNDLHRFDTRRSPIFEGAACTKAYTTITNKEGDALAEALEKLPGVSLTTCGSVNGGGDVFFSLALDKKITPIPGDENRCILNLMLNHTTLRAAHFMAGATRIVCDNTRALALTETGGTHITIRHTKSAPDRMKEAERLLTAALAGVDRFHDQLDLLLKKEFIPKRGDLAAYYDMVMPCPVKPITPPDADSEFVKQAMERWERETTKVNAIRHTMKDTFQREEALLNTKPSLWLAYNSVSRWAQHDWKPRGGTKIEDDKGAFVAQRLMNNIYGVPADIDNRAWSSALQLARN